MRLFGSDRVAKVMDRMGLEEGEVIQHSMMTKSIERAQKKVEENNFRNPKASPGIRRRHECPTRSHIQKTKTRAGRYSTQVGRAQHACTTPARKLY